MHKNTFCLHFDTVSDILYNCFVFQLPAIKLIKKLANCAITNMETISPFSDSSIDKLIQTSSITS